MSRSTPVETSPATFQLSNLLTRQDLANTLGTTDKGLCYILYGVKAKQKYTLFEIPKKSGGKREILAPIPPLKYLQKRLKRLLDFEYKPRSTVHGFVQQKGIRTNASFHVRKRHVFNVDLENFFPTITFPRIRGMLMGAPYNCSPEVATVIAQMCCCDSKLPQGAPTSPVISNMICSKLDGQLFKLAREHGWTYTRYADDLTFATNKKPVSSEIAGFENGIWNIGGRLNKIISDNGFKVNKNKVRMQDYSDRQEVTGIVTNKKLNVRRGFIRNIRAILYNWRKKGLEETATKYFIKYPARNVLLRKDIITKFKESIIGKIEHVGHIRDDDMIYLSFLKQIAELSPELITSKKIIRVQQTFDEVNFILDRIFNVEVYAKSGPNQLVPKQGTGFFLKGYGFVTCFHILDLDAFDIEKIIITKRNTKEQFEGIIKLGDEKLDLAIIDVAVDSPHYFEIGADDEQTLLIGTQIILAGFPKHSPNQRGNYFRALIRAHIEYIGSPFYEIDEAIYFGLSGGPIFNQEFKVVGIAARGKKNEKKESDNDFPGFYGFIPISQLKKLVIK